MNGGGQLSSYRSDGRVLRIGSDLAGYSSGDRVSRIGNTLVSVDHRFGKTAVFEPFWWMARLLFHPAHCIVWAKTGLNRTDVRLLEYEVIWKSACFP